MKPFFIAYILISFFLGCSIGATSMLRFQDRELLIHPDKPGLAYPHKANTCRERGKMWKWLGPKCNKQMRVDFYDLNSPIIRQKLIDAGFTCKSKMRFKY